jgi:tRNA pseudouridine38-40 synthase
LRSLQAYRLDLRYIGSDFHGWQSQPSGAGIQDHVERALGTVLRHPVRLIGAARTDSGVHAEQQVAVFHTAEPFNEHRWLRGFNALLPASVGIVKIAPVRPDFHPIYSATGKAYRYSFWCGAGRHPILEPFVWRLPAAFDHELFLAEARAVVGRHDFTSFCAPDSSAKTRTRTVLEIDLRAAGDLVEFWIAGHGFLKQMIRIIVGSTLDVCLARDSGGLARMLAARDRNAAGRTAPGHGLCLASIFYEGIPPLSAVQARPGLLFGV